MNEMVTLRENQAAKILQTVIDEKVPAIMSYSSKGKWHVAKVLLADIVGNQLSIVSTHSTKKQHPINIQVGQPVGISFKHEYGKFVFDTTVIGLEQTSSPQANQGCGGIIVLKAPEKVEVIQRRSYFRVEVPESLKVKVLLWHRSTKREAKDQIHTRSEQMNNCFQGRLIDISAGGAQIEVPYRNEDNCCTSEEFQSETDECGISNTNKPNFKKGQFIGLRFTPVPYETPLTLSAQIRNILPTADNQGISLGLQIVGLEASPEGHQVLTRLIYVVGRYYQMNQSSVKQLDKQPVSGLM
jgi:c-di-GMP-binding flagellar brake protein YcgR